MYIKPSWRVLTVGDGDLSFSYALHKRLPELNLCASILDSNTALRGKYETHCLDKLVHCKTPVYTEIDVTEPNSFSAFNGYRFDLVIFQFPLIPGFKSEQEYQEGVGSYSTNTLNRSLLRTFLQHAFTYLLDEQGQQLCYITSKDVKPYSDWNIENVAEGLDGIDFLGQHEFDITMFPEYQIRNVDKDNFVRDTQGTTYAWCGKTQPHIASYFVGSPKHLPEYCGLCGEGPLVNARARLRHENSKTHRRRTEYEAQWQDFLNKY